MNIYVYRDTNLIDLKTHTDRICASDLVLRVEPDDTLTVMKNRFAEWFGIISQRDLRDLIVEFSK